LFHLSPTYSYLFLIRLPHHPQSTLFPYTTLFRSRQILVTKPCDRNPQDASLGVSPPRKRLGMKRMRTETAKSPIANHRTRSSSIDRKSTRLNSSHVSISYAVFCLKKKKNTQQQIQ